MKAISFGHTWTSCVLERKNVTRRYWKDTHAARFSRGTRFEMLDRDRRYGGKVIGIGEVTDIYQERMEFMPDSDYEGEGFACFNEHPQLIPSGAHKLVWAKDDCSFAAFEECRKAEADNVVWVVRFKVISIEPAAIERVNKLLEAV